MISSRITRIAGAAILGTIVGTGPAYAQMSVDTSTDPDTVRNARQIAIETLGVGGTTTKDGATYYEIEGGAFSTIIHPLRARALNQQLVVTYTLENMVFTADNPLTAASLTVHQTFTAPTTLGTAATATVTLESGGKGGDNMAVFHVTAGEVFTAAYHAQLDIDELGLAATGTDDTGSITVSLTHVFAGTPTTSILPAFKDAYTVVQSLNEDLDLVAGTDVVATTATTASGYMKFGDRNNASVGGLRISADGTKGGNLIFSVKSSGEITGGGGNVPTVHTGAGTDIVRASPLVFEGDLSFVSDVTLATANTCPAAGETSVVNMDDDDNVTSWKIDVDVNALATKKFLCIHVDGMTNIPQTDSYSISVNYTPLANAALGPTGLKAFELGSIDREGVDVNIPYLTTSDGYNQRLVIRNRASSSVGYVMSFQPETGISAEAGDDATGTLAGNSTTVLRARDVVTLTGGSRTAATLNLETASANVDVATVQVNLSDGSTDTVTYSAQ